MNTKAMTHEEQAIQPPATAAAAMSARLVGSAVLAHDALLPSLQRIGDVPIHMCRKPSQMYSRHQNGLCIKMAIA